MLVERAHPGGKEPQSDKGGQGEDRNIEQLEERIAAGRDQEEQADRGEGEGQHGGDGDGDHDQRAGLQDRQPGAEDQVEQVQRWQADCQGGQEQQRELDRRDERLEPAVRGAEHRAVRREADHGGEQHPQDQFGQVTLADDLVPDPRAITQDALDDELFARSHGPPHPFDWLQGNYRHYEYAVDDRKNYVVEYSRAMPEP